MSYILDALKKSERERRQSSTPAVPTLNDNIADSAKKRSIWPYLIVAALALSAGIFASWAGIYYLKKPVMTAKLPSAKPLELRTHDALPAASTIKSEKVTAVEEKKGQKITPLFDASGSKKIDGIQQNQSMRANADLHEKAAHMRQQALDTKGENGAPPAAYEQTGIERAPARQRPDNDGAVPAPNKIYDIGELPLSIRQSLPAFSVSVFLYSDDAASRVIRINGQMVKEGQYLAEGLKLEEIIPNGVIFSYHKFRFHVDLK